MAGAGTSLAQLQGIAFEELLQALLLDHVTVYWPEKLSSRETPGRDSPVATMVRRLLISVIWKKASELDFVPDDKGYLVLAHINGHVEQALGLPQTLGRHFVTCLKGWASINLSSEESHLHGRFPAVVSGVNYSVEVFCSPSEHGERLRLTITQVP
jgi:type II secretory ATPase GspE/PulE/Tfp pilus assembly ATPase PilB-like protein